MLDCAHNLLHYRMHAYTTTMMIYTIITIKNMDMLEFIIFTFMLAQTHNQKSCILLIFREHMAKCLLSLLSTNNKQPVSCCQSVIKLLSVSTNNILLAADYKHISRTQLVPYRLLSTCTSFLPTNWYPGYNNLLITCSLHLPGCQLAAYRLLPTIIAAYCSLPTSSIALAAN